MQNAVFWDVLITADAVASLLILFTQTMEAILSSEKSILTRSTRCRSPEDGILPHNVCNIDGSS
jgi:hypothetical protein